MKANNGIDDGCFLSIPKGRWFGSKMLERKSKVSCWLAFYEGGLKTIQLVVCDRFTESSKVFLLVVLIH